MPKPPSPRRINSDSNRIPKVGQGAILIFLLVLSVIAFYISRSPVFAVAGFILILILVARDVVPSSLSSSDVKTSLVELAYAVGFALAVWIGLQLLLATSAPIDVVTSCSMLPNLQRGDLIVVQKSSLTANTINFQGDLQGISQGELKRVSSQCT